MRCKKRFSEECVKASLDLKLYWIYLILVIILPVNYLIHPPKQKTANELSHYLFFDQSTSNTNQLGKKSIAQMVVITATFSAGKIIDRNTKVNWRSNLGLFSSLDLIVTLLILPLG